MINNLLFIKMSKIKVISLGDRMKQYESKTKIYLPINEFWVARIDGHGFSKFTKGFRKPYDSVISNAMHLCMADLLKKFNAYTGYTQSDEITLIFPPIQDPETKEYRKRIYNGRVVKIASLLSGYASTRFNYHLQEELTKHLAKNLEENQTNVCDHPHLVEKIKNSTAFFDARIFSVPTSIEVYNNLYWRASYDCRRNAIHGFARSYFSTKELHKKNTHQMLTMVKEKYHLNYDQVMPDFYRLGMFIKNEQYLIDMMDIRSNEQITVTRTRSKFFVLDLKFCEKTVDLLSSKYY